MMKKLLPLLVLAVLATGFTSCKKDFKCSCTYTDFNGDTQTDVSTIEDSRRPEASLSCEALEIGYSTFTDGKCKLK